MSRVKSRAVACRSTHSAPPPPSLRLILPTSWPTTMPGTHDFYRHQLGCVLAIPTHPRIPRLGPLASEHMPRNGGRHRLLRQCPGNSTSSTATYRCGTFTTLWASERAPPFPIGSTAYAMATQQGCLRSSGPPDTRDDTLEEGPPPGSTRQVFDGHVCRFAGAAFWAARASPSYQSAPGDGFLRPLKRVGALRPPPHSAGEHNRNPQPPARSPGTGHFQGHPGTGFWTLASQGIRHKSPPRPIDRQGKMGVGTSTVRLDRSKNVNFPPSPP